MECHQAMVIHAKVAKVHVVHVDLVVHVVHVVHVVVHQVLVLVVLMDVDHVVSQDLHFQVIVDLMDLQTMDSMDLTVVLAVVLVVLHLDHVAMGSLQTIQAIQQDVQVILVCQWLVGPKVGNHNHQEHRLDLQDPWDSSCRDPVPLDHGATELENLG